MNSYLFFPPLPRLSGGLFVIADIARMLHEDGQKAFLVFLEKPNDQRRAEVEALAPGVPLLTAGEVRFTRDDLWLVPEGWPNALAPGLSARARCVVYVQNWAYLHGLLPPDAGWNRLPVRFLAVSQPVAWFVRETCGQEAPILRPAIDDTLFYPPERDPAAALTRRARIAWMPRKNKGLAEQTRDILAARLALSGQTPPEWIAIHGRSRAEVADLLRGVDIFLATGFPEGFALPPLEALACGCLVAGFAGFGGWDYMRQALGSAPVPPLVPTAGPAGAGSPAPGPALDLAGAAFRPWWPRREAGPDNPWGPNAFVVADADVCGAAFALESALTLLQAGGPRLAALREAGTQTAAAYSPARQRETLLALWKNF